MKLFIKLLVITLLMMSAPLYANNGVAYGLGKPTRTSDLPPGQFRKTLETLPAKARGRALQQLQEISFPSEDVEQLHVSPVGDVLYVDPGVEESEGAIGGPQEDVDPSIIFTLHSKNGSANVVYLDFDGMDLTDTGWNYSPYLESKIALPFDPSGDGPEFSQDEVNRIYNIWERVSEDYAPFNVDVTTEEPEVFTTTTGRVLITEDRDAEGECLYACGWGGVAWLNGFGKPDYVTRLSPALVFYDNLGNGLASYVAEATTHEFGHNIGLSHDGTSSSSYYRGHGTGLISWAPIMGIGYYRNVTTWSIGEYTDANNQQDDIAIIIGDLGVVSDDYTDLPEGAGPLAASGVINNATDVDWFYVDVDVESWLEIEVFPSWASHDYDAIARRGSNLDIELAVLGPDGTITVYDDPEDTKAVTGHRVSPGRYYIQVTGTSSVNYSQYNSMGTYYIAGGVMEGNQQPYAIMSRCPGNNGYGSQDGVYILNGQGVDIWLDGTQSYDKDGTVVEYKWVDSNGNVVGNDVIITTYIREGLHTFTLYVTDNDGSTSHASITVPAIKPLKKESRRRLKQFQPSCYQYE